MATVIYEPKDTRSGLVGQGLGEGLKSFAGAKINIAEQKKRRDFQRELQAEKFDFERDLKFDILELSQEFQKEMAKQNREFDIEQFKKGSARMYEMEKIRNENNKDVARFKVKEDLNNSLKVLKKQGEQQRAIAKQRREFEAGESEKDRESLERRTELQEINDANIAKLQADARRQTRNEGISSTTNKILSEARNIAQQLTDGTISLDDARSLAEGWNQVTQIRGLPLPTFVINQKKKRLQFLRSKEGSLGTLEGTAGTDLSVTVPETGVGDAGGGASPWENIPLD